MYLKLLLFFFFSPTLLTAMQANAKISKETKKSRIPAPQFGATELTPLLIQPKEELKGQTKEAPLFNTPEKPNKVVVAVKSAFDKMIGK